MKYSKKTTRHMPPRGRHGFGTVGMFLTVALCGARQDGTNSICLNRRLSNCDACKAKHAGEQPAAQP